MADISQEVRKTMTSHEKFIAFTGYGCGYLEGLEQAAKIAEQRIADAPDHNSQECAHEHGRAIAQAIRSEAT